MSDARRQFLDLLADRIEGRLREGVLRVAIDGVDGSGKTRLADELGTAMRDRGQSVIRASVDGFHNPRAVRYRLGKGSSDGFFRDSYNYLQLKAVLLDPLGPGGSRRYRSAVFDHRFDAEVIMEEQLAPIPSILLFDGIFLHRPELVEHWDYTIFLDVPFEQSYRRMAARDGSDPDPLAITNRRYHEGQRLYFSECGPRDRADVLVDYADLEAPGILRG